MIIYGMSLNILRSTKCSRLNNYSAMIRRQPHKKINADDMPELQDKDIILRCRNGDVEAFGEIVQRYQKMIYTIVYRMVTDPASADDITQTAFIKAYENLDRYKPEHPFFHWIHRIAVNEALNYIKQRKRVVELTDSHESSEDDPETEYSRNELQEQIDRALEDLKPDSRILIVLRHFGELSYREISEILDVPEKTVKSRLFSARQELRSILL